MNIDPIKLMLLGIMLMFLSGVFEAWGLEWVVFTAGVVVVFIRTRALSVFYCSNGHKNIQILTSL